MSQEVIRQEGDLYPVIKVTPRGSDVLLGKAQLMALKKEEIKVQERVIDLEHYNQILFERLRDIRKKMAEAQRVPPYVIFSDKTSHEMCRYYPDSLPKMKKISGVGEIKLEKYGEVFAEEIKKYLKENPDIWRDGLPSAQSDNFGSKLGGKKKISVTEEETYALFEKGFSVEDIAKSRSLTTSTIIGHLERLLQDGRVIDIDRLVEPAKRDKIEKCF